MENRNFKEGDLVFALRDTIALFLTIDPSRIQQNTVPQGTKGIVRAIGGGMIQDRPPRKYKVVVEWLDLELSPNSQRCEGTVWSNHLSLIDPLTPIE